MVLSVIHSRFIVALLDLDHQDPNSDSFHLISDYMQWYHKHVSKFKIIMLNKKQKLTILYYMKYIHIIFSSQEHQ